MMPATGREHFVERIDSILEWTSELEAEGGVQGLDQFTLVWGMPHLARQASLLFKQPEIGWIMTRSRLN
jgi:hypothetical protein